MRTISFGRTAARLRTKDIALQRAVRQNANGEKWKGQSAVLVG